MINPKILKQKVMAELGSGFRENNPKGVQVQGFMDAECYRQALSEISSADFKKSEQRNTHSYFEARPEALSFFSSKEFLSFASAVVGKKLTKAHCTLRIFLAGSYTLLHDNPEKGVEFYFDLTQGWNNEAGGAIAYLTAGGEKLAIPPSPNTLIIAEAGRSYVKYVNHLAGEEGRLVVYGVMKQKR